MRRNSNVKTTGCRRCLDHHPARGRKRKYSRFVPAGEGARRPVSRVLSASVDAGRPFLWDAPRGAPRATYPSDGAGTPLRQPGGHRPPAAPAAPIRSCSRWGLPCRPCYQGRGALLPHRFALADGGRTLAPAVCFLWHCPWGRPRRPLAGTVFPWSPDFPPTPGSVSGRPAVWRARTCGPPAAASSWPSFHRSGKVAHRGLSCVTRRLGSPSCEPGRE